MTLTRERAETNGIRRRRSSSTAGRSERRWAWLVLWSVVLILVLDVLWVGLGYALSLSDARSRLTGARDALSAGELETAASEFDRIADRLGSTSSFDKHPAFILASKVPVFGEDVRSIEALARSGEYAAEAGRTGAQALSGLGGDAELASAFFSDGQVRFDNLEELSGVLPEVDRSLATAEAEFEGLTPNIEALASIVREARAELDTAHEAASKGVRFTGLAPDLFGEGAARRYLLAFQTPAEARGTGGVIGIYGVLHATDGRLDLGKIGPYGELKPIKGIEAPRWFERTWGPKLSLKDWSAANASPSFPQVADVLLQMYASATGQRLDGVVAMDPIALAKMIDGTGPITVKGVPGQITADNAAEFMLHDSYLDYSPQKQNVVLERLVRTFWSRISAGDVDAPALASGMAGALRGQHLKVYARRTDEQEALVALDAAGDYRSAGRNVQLVFHNNASVNKVDYFLNRTITTNVVLQGDGSADVTTTATVINEAPDGPASTLLGPTALVDDPPGLNRQLLSFLLPRRAEFGSLKVNEEKVTPLVEDEGGYLLISEPLYMLSGQGAQVTVTYRIDKALSFGEGSAFEFTLFPAATVRPDDYAISIEAPDGYTLRLPGESAGVRIVSSEGRLDHVVRLRYELTR